MAYTYIAKINNVDYTQSDIVMDESKIQKSLYETFGIGNVMSAYVELKVWPKGETIPPAAEIVVTVTDTDTEEETTLGTFYVDERSNNTKALILRGYDAMHKADIEFKPTWVAIWPAKVSAILNAIRSHTGLDTSHITIARDYDVSELKGYTCWEVLGFIAASQSGNMLLNSDGYPTILPANPTGTAYDVGTNALSLDTYGEQSPVTGVYITANENTYLAGEETGYVIEIECPFGTQQMAEDILDDLEGFVYQGFYSEMAGITPDISVGSMVTVRDYTGFIAELTLQFNPKFFCNIGAPGDMNVAHEYLQQASIKRAIREVGIETDAKIDEFGDSIFFEGDQIFGPDGSVANLELMVGGESHGTAQVRVTGNLDISGQLSAQALYAQYGDMADLTVDRLSTSRRIVKYLDGDTTDDNYLRIEDEHIEFVAGIANGGEEQAKDPYGLDLFWEQDISGGYRKSDGYPCTENGDRIFTTTEQTAYPIMVYTYDEQVKSRYEFALESEGLYTPTLTLGAGNAQGTNQAYIRKGTEGLDITFYSNSQDYPECYMRMTLDGKVQIYPLDITSITSSLNIASGDPSDTSVDEIKSILGILDIQDITDQVSQEVITELAIKRTAALNFSGWSSGTFTETDEDDTTYSYTVAFDSDGRPVKITSGDSFDTVITW